MYRIAVAALVLAATGCATTGGGGSREGNATVAGVVRLPQSGLQLDGACDQVRVVVSSPGNPSDALGSAMVRTSRGGRCSFTVSSLPSNTDLQVGVAVDGGLKCENGATPTITPEPSPVKLGDYATVNRDFTLSCGA
ncbi:hypothetical protein HPC49_33145 [Pyxidicoccus fallax]|uniref:Lipoprotein n=1 Tax=Pyxidicoccus fallax TaxID=394095 RepID=A0A848LCK2_9BACT|nr:hypothetical protein [Pyxidicoccus fallax]NMO16699.1 hypothetical protein [Pyxidicoccus fallax]NPC83056.1 hypothetical protein [Pyxidicoccus fallax]